MTTLTRRFMKSLSDSDVLSRTDYLVREERRITLELLHYLRELESRMLYAEAGFASLHDYLTKDHLYSGGSAQRRIQAMRALVDLPELEEAIQEGKLNLTTTYQIQTFLTQEAKHDRTYSLEGKRELFERAHCLSSRDTEKMLVSISPESALPGDREREIAPGKTQITFTSDDEFLEMLKRVKELTSHQDPNPGYLKLLKLVAKIALQDLDPEKKQTRNSPTKPRAILPMNRPTAEQTTAVTLKPTPAPAPVQTEIFSSAIQKLGSTSAIRLKFSRHIPAATQRAVWIRDQGRCQFKSQATGRKCESRFLLQTEHKIPVAKGGTHDLENLELLCATHNRLRALQSFGKSKMSRYLPKLAM